MAYHELALSQYEKELEWNLETLEVAKPLLEFRRKAKDSTDITLSPQMAAIHERLNGLLDNSIYYELFVSLKEMIGGFSGTIIRLHSY